MSLFSSMTVEDLQRENKNLWQQVQALQQENARLREEIERQDWVIINASNRCRGDCFEQDE